MTKTKTKKKKSVKKHANLASRYAAGPPAWNAPACGTDRQQTWAGTWANRSEHQHKQIKAGCGVNSGTKNTFLCKLGGAGTEMQRKRQRDRETERQGRDSETERERRTHTDAKSESESENSSSMRKNMARKAQRK